MPFIDSKSALAKELAGVHLFHSAGSNCSQRVRIALEEKGVPWTSHHLDLARREHHDPAYVEIHPHGLVPALVHDGRVMIESIDIISYIDEAFEGPALSVPEGPLRGRMMELLKDADSFQGTIRVLSYDVLFRGVRTISAGDIEAARGRGVGEAMLAFMRDYSEAGDAWGRRVDEGRREADAALARLERGLERNPWLAGPEHSLADIAWSVNALRLAKCRHPTDAFPLYTDWARRAMERPAFERAVSSYVPR